MDTEPRRGYCYNVDGLCEDDHCRCWDDEKRLREYLKEQVKVWERMGIKDPYNFYNEPQKKRRAR